ncbi:SAM-dependent methyltransferase [Actinomadura litoris]|uniref:S-adenosyl methyltransferase n=1 Tax=Actinomadura litoris TaxID=2678616 RepID=A0A7K1LB56_9ACTN|nr:SAM-dependent methyltransferase [Actinomadura litoris]MUN41657.1 hypothetical protein [Actinomadura litoris]
MSLNKQPRDTYRPQSADLEVGRASAAGMYNVYQGGLGLVWADWDAAQKVMRAGRGEVPIAARENARFAARAAAWAARAYGIEQVLDIGVSLVEGIQVPTVEEAVRGAVPAARVLACDNNPVVIRHAQAWRGSPDSGYEHVFLGDVRAVEQILSHPELTRRFRRDRPVLVALVAVLHFVAEAEDPVGILTRLGEGLPEGSVLVFSHACAPEADPAAAAMAAGYENASSDLTFRTEPAVAAMLQEAGWEVTDPGVTDVQRWAPPGERYRGEPSPSVRVVGAVATRPRVGGRAESRARAARSERRP